MPTYAYTCPKCGHEFTKFHKMNAKVRPKCPECGTVAVQQITGGAGLHFKGSGFYITDYRKAGKEEKAEKAEKADQAGKAEKADQAGKAEKADKTAGTAESAPKDKKPDSPKKGSDS